MSNPYIVVVREVYEDGGKHCLEVAPDGDGIGCVEIRATGEKNIEYWGPLRFAIPKDMAVKLAEAILACASEIEQ